MSGQYKRNITECPVCGESFDCNLPQHLRRECEGVGEDRE